MTSIDTVIIEASDRPAAQSFYTEAFDLGARLETAVSDAPTSGFRGFTMSLVVPQPSTVDHYFDAAVRAGATVLKEAKKSFWGYGGVVRSPDGAVWQFSTSKKQDVEHPAVTRIDDVVLLLGVADVKASKRYYADRGFTVGKSFGGKYAEFKSPDGGVKLALYSRRGLAKIVGTTPEGDGSHRIVLRGGAEDFTDPDGFVWNAARA